MNINHITERIIGAAIFIHRDVGPGLLESAYHQCMAHTLTKDGFDVEVQKLVPLIYDGVQLDCSYRADIVVDGLVVLEVKAVEQLHAVHDAQLLTYLRLLGCPVGLLINFNVVQLRHGLRRIALDPNKKYLTDEITGARSKAYLPSSASQR
jgi:GxxExxY protein